MRAGAAGRHLPRLAQVTAVLVLSTLLQACGAVQSRTHGHTGHESAAGRCVVQEISRERLLDAEGRQLYIYPEVMSRSSRGEMLLAGSYNLIQNVEGKWQPFAKDSVFGAVLPPSGGARVVISPIPLHLTEGIRAVARPDGTWVVVFAEVAPQDTLRDSTVALWHGVLDGQRWTVLERLPFPTPDEGTPVYARSGSRLIATGEGLAWALPHRAANGTGAFIVYEKIGGRWAYEIIHSGYASPDLAYSDDLGLVVASHQADRRLREDGSSIVLWVRQPTWRILHRAVSSSRSEVRRAWFDDSPAGPVLTWRAEVRGPEGSSRFEAHVMHGSIQKGDGPIVVLDPAVHPFSKVWFLPLSHGVNLWISEHAPPGGPGRDIRFARDSAGTTVLLGSIPSPYEAFFGAAQTGPSEILISGLAMDRERTTLFSLLIRVRVECPRTSSWMDLLHPSRSAFRPGLPLPTISEIVRDPPGQA